MLLYPAIDELKTKVDSRYTLAVLTARRTRDIVDGKPTLTINETGNPLSVATAEVYENLISYKRLSDEELLAKAERKVQKRNFRSEMRPRKGGFAGESFKEPQGSGEKPAKEVLKETEDSKEEFAEGALKKTEDMKWDLRETETPD